MGASASKAQSGSNASDSGASGAEKLQQLNRTLTNRLEDHTPLLTSEKEKDVSLPRQQYLDSSIQGKIREELSKLRKQESEVRQQIEQALEKENLDRASQSSSKGAKGKSSIILHQELEDVRIKIEKHNQRKSKVEKAPGVKQAREKVLECYKKKPEHTLECWSEIKDFKDAVSRAERDFVTALTAQ
ncbi:hypothetical protein CBS101457_001414 [Exobasidium rhododendri]|nr:hypothetical protein CBS101457_001414 [Exobasidium rhododendri]